MSAPFEVQRLVAFSSDPSGGNPAGVVLDASGASASEMLSVASEVGYSETAFVFPRGELGHYDIRYYSPMDEVTFCGHATIATAVALAERDGPGRIILHTRAGVVPVDTRVGADGVVTATLMSVPSSINPVEPDVVNEALSALGWRPEDLDPALPAKVADAGAAHLVLAVATRARLADLDYDFDRLAKLMADQGWTTLHLVWRESADVFHARDPFPPGGVVEDAATGAAAAAFGGYLKATGTLTAPASVRIHQGEDMGRPSIIDVDITADNDRVGITGAATPL